MAEHYRRSSPLGPTDVGLQLSDDHSERSMSEPRCSGESSNSESFDNVPESRAEYDDVHRHSAIESYIDDEDYESDTDTDLTLFHRGYRLESPPRFPHDEEAGAGIVPVPIPARVPTPLPSRQPTLDKPQFPLPRNASTRSRRGAKAPSGEDDPNLVTWDGSNDPLNPHNWPIHRRWTSTVLIAMYAFIAPMASTMLAPALPAIADSFNIRSEFQEFLVMSIFLLAFAIGPFAWGPLSEVFGRVRVMQGANLIFLVFNTMCGFAKTKEQMMAFRFLSGIGGSAPQAIGGGITSDCFRAGERGAAIAIYSLMPFLSPAVAPIMGGYMTQYISWRWVFWATSILDGVVQIACVFLLRETHHPTILAKKARALRAETGNQELHTKWQGPDHSLKKILMKSLIRPFIMLTTQPALQAMALFRGYQYGLMYLVFATFPLVWEQSYGQDVGRASLSYLSLGVGFVIGLQISGFIQDRIYSSCKKRNVDPTTLKGTWTAFRRPAPAPETDVKSLLHTQEEQQTRNRDFAISRKPVPTRQSTLKRRCTAKSLIDPTKGLPEYRLPLVLPFSLLIPIGIFIYGWAAHYRVHWIVPNIGTCIMAIGLIVCFNCAQAYVVDTYTTYAASATGAAAFVRTMCGFSFPLFAPQMYRALGVGWGNSLLGFVSLTLGMVAPVLLWRYGGWLRSKSTYCTG